MDGVSVDPRAVPSQGVCVIESVLLSVEVTLETAKALLGDMQ